MGGIVCPACVADPCLCNRPETITHPTGGKRDAENIPDYSLIPSVSLRRLAERYSHGRAKYGLRNWEKGLSSTDCLNRACEHLAKYCSGDRTEDHLAAVAWNVFAVMYYEAKGMCDHE